MSSNAVSTITWARTTGSGQPDRPRPRRLTTVTAPTARHARTAGWADLLGRPSPESSRSRDLAHLGGFAAMTALVGYLTWRIAFTLPAGGPNAVAAWTLIAFEAIPLVGMTFRGLTAPAGSGRPDRRGARPSSGSSR